MHCAVGSWCSRRSGMGGYVTGTGATRRAGCAGGRSCCLRSFVPLVTMYVVLALTVGGTGNNWGAGLVVFFPESTRFATAWLPGLQPVQAAVVREFIIGASLILVLRFRPAGLLPERLPRMPISLTATPSPESR